MWLVKNVHRLLKAALQGHQHGIGGTLNDALKRRLFVRKELAEDVAHHALALGASILRRNANFEAREVLGAKMTNEGTNAIVAGGAAIPTKTQAAQR